MGAKKVNSHIKQYKNDGGANTYMRSSVGGSVGGSNDICCRKNGTAIYTHSSLRRGE